MEGSAPVTISAGLVHLFPGPMGKQQDDCPQVLLGCSPQEMLAQRKLQALQRGKEELLLIFGSYPALFFFPRETKGDKSLPPGFATAKWWQLGYQHASKQQLTNRKIIDPSDFWQSQKQFIQTLSLQ